MGDNPRETSQAPDLDLQLKQAEIDLKKADLEIRQIEMELRKADMNLKKAEMFEKEVSTLDKAWDLLDMLDSYDDDDKNKLIKSKVIEFLERCNKFAKKMTAVDD